MLAPVVLLLYNRIEHTKKIVQALQLNDLARDSDLYVFCDGPKSDATIEEIGKVHDVQNYAKTIVGFKSVHITIQEKNKGLAKSTIDAITEVINKYGKVIMTEDDSLTHPFFLRYMNEALSFYDEDKRIYCISAMTDRITIPTKYKKDIFVVPRFGAWGFGTWIDRWATVEWDITRYPIFSHTNNKKEIAHFSIGGEDLWPMLQAQAQGRINSWAIRFQYNMISKNKLCLRPVLSFLTNIGYDGTGVHCGTSKTGIASSTMLYDNKTYHIKLEKDIKINKKIVSNYRCLFARPKLSLVIRIKRFAKKCIQYVYRY